MDRNKIQKLDNFEGVIRPIDIENDIGNLANFFNEIDDLWPGTWTHGIAYTEKRAKEFIEKRNALVNFVAFNPEGKLVGFCSVHRLPEEANVSYIGLLGVHPSVLSKKYGKHLLLAAIEYSVKNGDLRQDLHTWASNMKAVPLYKKVGLQWVPDTSVFMQNYIPAILQNHFCKPFFDKHPDWYLDQKRELNQSPDELTFGKMKIFEYHFENGDDFLTVIIDRYSRSISGVKRKIDGKLIELVLKQENHEVFAGFKEKMILSVNNGLKEELPISITFSASHEFSLDKNQVSSSIPKGSSEITNSYVIKDITPDSKTYRKAPSIQAHINVEGEILTLETGVRARQPVRIFSFTGKRWLPAGTHDFIINLKNHTQEEIEGELLLWISSDITVKDPLQKVVIDPEGIIGVKTSLTIPETDETLFKILHCQLKMKNSKTMVFEIPIFTSNDPSVTAGLLKEQKKVLIQNREIRVTINLEGAGVIVSDLKGSVMDLATNIFDHGPPFGFSEFNQVEFSPTISITKEKALVKLTSKSRSKPNLIMSRIIELQAGNPYISIWEEIENQGTIDDRVTVLLTPRFTNGVNLPLGDLYLGLNGEVIHGLNYLWPASDGDLPEDGFEPWACIKSGDMTYFHIYETQRTKAFPSRSKLTTLEKSIQIKALSSSQGSKTWLGVSRNMNISSVRKLAFYLGKKAILSEAAQKLPMQTFLDISVDKNDLLLGSVKNSLKVSVKSYRNMPLTGTLSITCPDGWQISPETVEISNLNINNSHDLTFEITLPKDIKLGVYPLVITINSSFSIIRKEILVLAYNSSRKPKIEELPSVQEKKVFSVDNSILKLKTSPDFIGCITSLTFQEREILKCNFPNLIPSVFFNQDPGGLFTVLIGMDDDFEDLKFFQEKFVISEIVNDPWYGFEYTVDVNERKSLKGLVFKASYEILGGDSNLVKVNIKVENPTSAVFQFISLNFLSVGFDNSLDNIISDIVFKRREMSYALTRENPIPIFGLGNKNLKRLTYKKDDLTFAVIPADDRSNLAPIEAGNMILGGGVFTFWHLEPGQTDNITFYLVANDGSEAFLESLQNFFTG
ncbi:MAG: GNAT family N-acetyltransferase [Candidatus Hodarchaeales archaeon]